MRSALTVAALLGLTLATPALAQTTTPSTPTAPSASSPTAPSATPSTAPSSAPSTTASNSTTQPGQMQEMVKQDLMQAGFSDVQVMPSSFLVRAKDKAGRPVMMVINPDSITEVTGMGAASGAGTSNGTGTGSSSK